VVEAFRKALPRAGEGFATGYKQDLITDDVAAVVTGAVILQYKRHLDAAVPYEAGPDEAPHEHSPRLLAHSLITRPALLGMAGLSVTQDCTLVLLGCDCAAWWEVRTLSGHWTLADLDGVSSPGLRRGGDGDAPAGKHEPR
jgi:hypothetical protein